MRRYIFASHHYLAYGLKDTVNFLTNEAKKIYDINAYVKDDEKDLEIVVKELFDTFDPDDEVIVLTDLMGGSVYQKFYPYICDHVHVICGMNLSLAMGFLLAPEDVPFTSESVASLLEECRNQIVYVNQLCSASAMDCDDE
ncbi:MAG: PTS sorbitol transporter subunit IIB [Erysipelotrichaceae bacterium]|jgi:fructoselysine and glucoselysine-specific PTS system IIA component|nr:PTS sorbitol transporter subunit IIB [Erysipelotrichaceae bacterium]